MAVRSPTPIKSLNVDAYPKASQLTAFYTYVSFKYIEKGGENDPAVIYCQLVVVKSFWKFYLL